MINNNPYNWGGTVIDGYSYILEPADDYGISFTENVIGLTVNHTSSWIFLNIENSSHVNGRKLISTKRRE